MLSLWVVGGAHARQGFIWTASAAQLLAGKKPARSSIRLFRYGTVPVASPDRPHAGCYL